MKETMFLIAALIAVFLIGLYFFVEVMSATVWTKQTWRELMTTISCFGAFGYTVLEVLDSKGKDLESIAGE